MNMANDADRFKLLQVILQATESDLAAYGVMDAGTRKLRWLHAAGGVSERTPLIRQAVNKGLSGEAIRSGRTSKRDELSSDTARFKLGEAIAVTENLRSAAALPLLGEPARPAVLLIGRREASAYLPEQLAEAERLSVRL